MITVVAAIAITIVSFTTGPRVSAVGVEVRVLGVRVMTVPFRDVERVSVRRRVEILFTGNPVRTLSAGGCVRDDAVLLERRRGWFRRVVLCPSDREGFVDEVERRIR